jgi:hypothetical protein
MPKFSFQMPELPFQKPELRFQEQFIDSHLFITRNLEKCLPNKLFVS